MPRAAHHVLAGRVAWFAAPGLALFGAALYVSGEPSVTAAGGLGFPLDDSWIHLQFAKRLADADGLSYNAGQWVTGSTAPLWSALLAALSVLPGSVLAWVKVLGIVLHGLATWSAQRLARALGLSPGTTILAGMLTAASGWLLWSAPSAMEVPLATFLSLAGIERHLIERRRDDGAPPVSMALFGLAMLARPEMALLFLLAVSDRLLSWQPANGGLSVSPSRRTAWLEGVVVAAVVVLPTLVFYRAIGGSWLPSTFAVKARADVALMPSLRYLRVVADILFRSQPVLLLAAAAGALRLVTALGHEREDRGLLPAMWLFGLPLAYSLLSPPAGPFAVGNFGRYYFPLLPLVILLGLYGLAPLTAKLPSLIIGRLRIPLGATLAAGLIVLAVADGWAGRARYLQSVSDVEASAVRAARWLAERLPAQALVATQDIGAVKYLLPNDVLDLAGIVTPEVVDVLRGGPPGSAWEQRLLDFLAAARPDVIVAFPSSYPQLLRSPGFDQLVAFDVPGNVTMAGGRLAIFSTPWNRFPIEP